uniref:Large ribosomal subunit protein uL22m n=1 Tax=Trichobilharzia regenti TaxID=157069 RepID=A0AA85KIN2_TRIRE|nr:unnamed protein product [Trichobilharzia regenti]
MFSIASKTIQKLLSTAHVRPPKCFLSTTVSVCKKNNIKNWNGTTLISKATGRNEDLWSLYNEVVYPPLPKASATSSDLSEHIIRPGEVTHRRDDIFYSQKRLWLLAQLIRGRSVDDAFAQLGFRPEKGARILEEVLEEAIELAVKEHDFEFCTKIWIESLYALRGRMVPRLHKGIRSTVHKINFHYTNLYIRLREGDPPKLYHPNQVKGVWTPVANCPPEGRKWGSTREMVHRELHRLRSRELKGNL